MEDNKNLGPRPSFHLEINSLEDFVAFCAFIKGGDLDAEHLAKLTRRFAAANDKEAATVAANTPRP